MGKIIGKSALCFAGLVIASWLAINLFDWIQVAFSKGLLMHLPNIDVFYEIYVLFFYYILAFLIAILFPYILFLAFKHERRCYLIITINGLFAIMQHYLLIFLYYGIHLNFSYDIILASLIITVPAGFSATLMSLMFRYLTNVKTPIEEYTSAKLLNSILRTFGKFTMCLLFLMACAFGYDQYRALMPGLFTDYINLRGTENMLFFIIPYACCLFWLLRRHKNRLLLIIINALLLLVIQTLLMVFIIGFPVVTLTICGNASVTTVILALVFRSVEKHDSTALPANQKAPEGSLPPAQ